MKKKSINISYSVMTAMITFICVLALVLSSIMLITSIHMSRNAKAIYEHPYTTTNASREMRSRLIDMKQFVVIFFTDPTNDEETLVSIFESRYMAQDESIEKIRRHYSGPKSDVDKLADSMELLKKSQSRAIEDIFSLDGQRIITEDNISEYFEKNVYPYYDGVDEKLNVIIAFSDANIHELEQQILSTVSISIPCAVIFPIVIIGFALYVIHLERRRQRKDVIYREKIFDLLYTNLDDVFIIEDLSKGIIEYVSPNCEQMLGISPEKFTSLDALKSKLMVEDAYKLSMLFEDGILQKQVECELRLNSCEDGKTRWISLKVYPVRRESEIDRYIISISDQTAGLTIQQTLREALAVAQNANNTKKEFLSRMSHEIRTPLNAVIGMTAIAATYIDDQERVEDCLAKISFSSKHLLSLVNDVLDMSKIEDNKIIVSHEPFEFKQLIESVTAIIYSQSQMKGLLFEERIIGCDEEVLVGDAMRVNQILLNLLSNAVKFTPEGGKISLDIMRLKRTNTRTRIRFTVSDNGVGMTEEFLSRLYSPFEQADASTAQNYGGTGLGMSITKNLVILLGGTIDVKSELGVGTTFTVEIPFELPKQSLKTEMRSELHDLDILVVDDDKDTCLHIDILLKRMGIKSKWVLTGEEAVSSVCEEHQKGTDFDVCIIDWQMPQMDGIETTRRIRKEIGPNTPIIILSAYDWSGVEDEAREAGVNAFIAKPLFESTLYNTLISIAGQKNYNIGISTSQETFDFNGKHVLLVEDNELNMEIAVELLKMTGAEIDCAFDGKQAYDKYFNKQPFFYDLILMDIQMPVMNGYESTHAIRSSGKEDADTIPIFAMTANAFNEDVAVARENGMDGHIAKPIDVNYLYKIMSQQFESKKE